jgi:hypothetical protein
MKYQFLFLYRICYIFAVAILFGEGKITAQGQVPRMIPKDSKICLPVVFLMEPNSLSSWSLQCQSNSFNSLGLVLKVELILMEVSFSGNICFLEEGKRRATSLYQIIAMISGCFVVETNSWFYLFVRLRKEDRL